MRFDAIQSDFTAGEISPKLWGRVELEKYFQSSAVVENLIVQPQGGLIRRGGTHFVAETKNSDLETTLIPFTYLNIYKYILEFGHLYMRVYHDQAQVLTGASPYEIVTPYSAYETKNLRFAQDKDTLYITHHKHAPAKLTRTAHNNWTLEDIAFVFDSNYETMWNHQVSAANNDWTSVCWSPGLSLFCAISSTGVGNRVMTSPDGVTWTPQVSAADNDWTSICWSPELSLFCVVSKTGTGNRVMTSPDGVTWTIQVSAVDNDWTSVCWSPGLSLFCAVSETGTRDRVMISSNGVTWLFKDSLVDNDWQSVCWSPELSLFVAVSKTGTGDRVLLSPDGELWISRVSAEDNDWTSICWSPDLRLFVAVSDTGTNNRVMTSPNGSTWTIQISAADNKWSSICWSSKLFIFTAVANTGAGNRVMTSFNGTTWSIDISIPANDWQSVCWSPELSLFVAVSTTGVDNRVMTSKGRSPEWTIAEYSVENYKYTHTWEIQDTPLDEEAWRTICWSPKLHLFAAFGFGVSDQIMTSPDGITWTLQTTANVNNLETICWSPKLEIFLAIGGGGVGDAVLYSSDGVTWNNYNLPVGQRSAYDGLCWSPLLEIFCAVAWTGPEVLTSSDGLTWSLHTAANVHWCRWRAVCWSPELNLFVAVGSAGHEASRRVMTSPDGENWTERTATGALRDVCWSPELGIFCAVGEGGTIRTSSNGLTWDSQTAAANNDWRSICWAAEIGLFIAVAITGTINNRIMTSPDGIEWTSRTSAADNDWQAICWSPELLLLCAVSKNGTNNRAMTSQAYANHEGYYLPGSGSGYPALNWFFEQRHFFAATSEELNGIWGSQSTEYTNMQQGVGLDNESLQLSIKAAHKFLWVSSGQEIILGGSNAEFKLSANAINEAMTPSNVRPVYLTPYGSAFIDSVQVGGDVFFVQKGNRKISIFGAKAISSGYREAYEAHDAAGISDHIATSGILKLDYSSMPDSILWALRTDGVIIGLTYDSAYKVSGWHRHIIGGTDTKIKSLTVSRVVEGDVEDEIWMIVERTINGSPIQYIEYMTRGLPEESDIEDAFFVDSGITKTGDAFTVVTGLDHLEGEEVQILGDGLKQTPKTVASGQITLDTAVDKVHVGLQYISAVETLPIEGGNPIGTSQSLIKRVGKVSLRLDRSLYFKLGDVHGNMDAYSFDSTSLFTGDTELIPFAGAYDRQSRVRIEQEEPLPFNLLAIMYQARTK